MRSKKLKGIIAIAVVGAIISTITPVKASAEWLQDSENNWSWTENGNGAIGWKQVDGTWYHFDANGKMQTGWVKAEDSKWYYMNTNGSMKTGWLKDSDGKWYNLAPSGEMKTGWIQETDGKWYFTDVSGAMQTGVIQVEGKSYALEQNGAMLIGQNVLTEGNTYTTDNNGVIIEGNTSTNGREFTKDGVLITPDANSSTGKATTTVADTSNSTGSSSSSSSSSSSVNIVSAIEEINDINVQKGTELNLPSSVNITLSNKTTISVPVTWNGGNPAYDKDLVGAYAFIGTITLPTGVINTNNLKASVKVNVFEDVVQANKIKSIEELSNISVPKGTVLHDSGLPNSVHITLTNNTTTSAAVNWSEGNYDRNTPGTYTLNGTITLPEGVTNPNNLKASVKVNVLEYVVQANEVKSIEGLSDISLPKGRTLDQEGLELPSTVEITLGNNTTTSAAVNWSEGTYDVNTPGTYGLGGELTLPEGLINPNNLKAHLSIVVVPTEVIVEGGFVEATAGSRKITGLTSGKCYRIIADPTGTATMMYTKEDGTLTANESEKAALAATEITGLTNGITYRIEEMWEDVGAEGFSDGAVSDAALIVVQESSNPSSPYAQDYHDTPYVAYIENGNKVVVKKYSSGAWTEIGSVPNLNNNIKHIGLEQYMHAKYIAYIDDANNLTISSLDANGNFSILATEQISGASVDYIKLDLYIDRSQYDVKGLNVAYAQNGNVNVDQYNMYTNSWKHFGTAGTLSSHVNYIRSDAFALGLAMVSYIDNENKMTGKFYGPDSNTSIEGWQTQQSSMEIGYNSLPIDNETSYVAYLPMGMPTPYVVYRDSNNGDKVTVKKFDSQNWVNVGVQGFSRGSVGNMSIYMSYGTVPYVYVAYQDKANGNKVTVKKLNQGNQGYAPV